MLKYIIAIYLRLSIDDKKVESMSIESQRQLLRKFAADLPIDNVEIVEYVDNGYSGTNFERPAVQELLDDVRAMKVNCIIVKDFSRFGRNSIEVGYFTQQVFPYSMLDLFPFLTDMTAMTTKAIQVVWKLLSNTL